MFSFEHWHLLKPRQEFEVQAVYKASEELLEHRPPSIEMALTNFGPLTEFPLQKDEAVVVPQAGEAQAQERLLLAFRQQELVAEQAFARAQL
jgi:hypothetical protein